MARGVLIAVEGIDASGKSSVCLRLTEACGGTLRLWSTRMPSVDNDGVIDTMRGRLWDDPRDIETAKAMLRLRAAQWSVDGPAIERDLRSGHNVLCDGYPYGAVARVMAASGQSAIDASWAEETMGEVVVPDLLVLVDIDPLHAAHGVWYGSWEGDPVVQHQRDLREALLDVTATIHTHVYHVEETWNDGNRRAEEEWDELMDAVRDVLARVGLKM